MSKETQFKKELQARKKVNEDKKIELISRLCVEEPTRKKQPLKN